MRSRPRRPLSRAHRRQAAGWPRPPRQRRPRLRRAPPRRPLQPERNPDEAWIETARCPSCDECQTINDKMFKYNDNKQAFITDVKLGTYRQLVEAAEACQVSIIHPGKPWNPNEPGLDELIARAEAFR